MAPKSEGSWGGSRPGAGRKPMPDSKRVYRYSTLRLRDSTRKTLKAAADKAGTTFSAFVRLILEQWEKRHK